MKACEICWASLLKFSAIIVAFGAADATTSTAQRVTRIKPSLLHAFIFEMVSLRSALPSFDFIGQSYYYRNLSYNNCWDLFVCEEEVGIS